MNQRSRRRCAATLVPTWKRQPSREDVICLVPTLHVERDLLHTRFSHDPGRLPPGSVAQLGDGFTARCEQWSRIVPLSATRPDPRAHPHFLIPPIGGGVDCYAALARELAPAWACYGLPADAESQTASVDGLAGDYVHRLRVIQPRGPYVLTGWSFGAAVALQMARHLEADGHTVARLALLDPPIPNQRSEDRKTLVAHLTALLPTHPHQQLLDAVDSTAELTAQVRMEALLDRLNLAGTDQTEHDVMVRRLRILLRHHTALASWQPTATVNTIDLIVSADAAAHADYRDTLRRWRQMCRRDLTLKVLPGGHLDMLTGTALADLAAHLRPTDILATGDRR